MLDDLDDVHNHFLALEKRYYRRYGLYAGRFRLQPHLTKLLQRTHKHWAWNTLDEVIVRTYYERFFGLSRAARGTPEVQTQGTAAFCEVPNRLQDF